VSVTIAVDGRADFTLESFRRVAVGRESVRIGKVARERMTAARAGYLRLIEAEPGPLSGAATTGGPVPGTRMVAGRQPVSAIRDAGRLSLGDSFGSAALPDRAVRGIIFARLVDFVEGHTGSRAVVAEWVAGLLDGPAPRVPLGGETSPGEIIALLHVMAGFQGQEFEEAECEQLLSGSPCSSALAADVALQSPARLATAEQVFALSVEAMNAPLAAYHPALKELWGDPYAAAALDNLNRALAGAKDQRRAYQAPVSYRVLPRVLGQAHRAVAQAEEAARISLQSATSNSLYLAPDEHYPEGRVLHAGGYHNALAYSALDAVNAAFADLCTLCDRHTTKLHREAVSLLPDLLVPPGADPWSTTGRLGFVQVGFAERARHAAARTLLPPSQGGGYAGQDDVALPIFLAYEKSLRAAGCLDACLAVLGVVASQAMYVTDRRPPAGLTDCLDIIRQHVPPFRPGIPPRRGGDEIARLAQAFGTAALGRPDHAEPTAGAEIARS
jgi:histidine ammonia-lyase